MDDQDRGFGNFGKRDGAMRGLPLDRERPGGGVVFRLDLSGGFQTFGQPCQALEVFGMNHDQRAEPACRSQNFENLSVGQTHRLVGHINLERRAAGLDKSRQLLAEHRACRVRHDEVECIVHVGFASSPAMIVGNGFP